MDPDRLSRPEAAYILGVSQTTVGAMLRDGRLERTYRGRQRFLSRDAVELVAATRWRRRKHRPGGYWATAREARSLLGVGGSRVAQLVADGKLPALHAGRSGHELPFRREQLEVIANARRAMWHT